MGLIGNLASGVAAGALGGAIKKAIERSKKGTTSSGGSSSSGGVASSTTISLRDYMGQKGLPVDYDAATGKITLGGKQYATGAIPGTSYNPTSGQHYVTDPNALNSALDITTPQQPQQPQQYIVESPRQQNEYDTTEYINQLKAAKKTEGPFDNPGLEDDSKNDNVVLE